MKQLVRVFLALVLAVGVTGIAQAQDQFVLTAPRWGANQNQAVTDAGGIVVFSHDDAGVAVVRSSAPDFLDRVRASSAITSADPDVVVQWQPDPTDVLLEQVVNPTDDTLYFLQWAPRAIDAPAAWALGCTGEGVRVAIVDGGLFNAHPDLAANVDKAASRSFVAGQPYNNDTGTFWHATHVAGIVAAVDNNIGVIGIAPKATIIGVKVLHSGTGSFGAVISGILYSATPRSQGGAGADIINMSLGATFERAGGAGSLIGALAKAVNYANRYRVLVISAVGNNALDLDHSRSYISVPAQSGSGLAVSATAPLGWAYGATDFDRPASYTNYGVSAVNVSAPGGDFAYPGDENCTLDGVTAPCWVFDMVLSTSRGTSPAGGYAWAAGTSMAAPAATAVAAIIKQRNPDISLGAWKTALQNTAVDAGDHSIDPYHGKGWVNALNACTR